MSLPYFFIPDDLNGSIISLPDETARHCVQVLRMQTGDQLILTDGRGRLYNATLKSAGKRSCTVAITGQVAEPRLNRRVSIAISPLKNTGRFEWFLEKAVEIGVSRIIPMICQRTEKLHFRAERMHNILVSAMLQSRQSWLPDFPAPQSFEQVVTDTECAQKLIAHCEEAQKAQLSSFRNREEVLILIGPEGDFTPAEIALALQNGYRPVSLGSTRLRTETAGMVAAALLVNAV